MGHVRNYSIGDAIARFKRMTGHNVLQPMGWDAFGLPAENAAIEHGVHPHAWTSSNIEMMREQLKRLGFAIDWSRELATCDPNYYRWEQLFFLRLREKGLAYRSTGPVNWDPVDETVLANEQVIDGCGWRTGAPVERREIPMWQLRITAYAEELLRDIDKLAWPDAVKHMQRNWIGRSEGMTLGFPLAAGDGEPLRVYTTRPDTIAGTTFMAVAAEHPLAQQAAAKDAAVKEFCQHCTAVSATEAAIAKLAKKGIALGLNVLNPLTAKPIPVWVTNYVLMSYGEGAVMGVPGHDERDFDFAQANGLAIVRVVAEHPEQAEQALAKAWTGLGRVVNSGPLDGLDLAGCYSKLEATLGPRGLAERTVRYRLRDWGISRQRYWGCPVPIIHCPRCGEVAVPEADLPVILPTDAVPDGRKSPLLAHPDFANVPCPQCQGQGQRDPDTFDTFVESSWYFMRYACPDAANTMLDQRAAQWLPVDQYIGGIEHAVLHLLYARFFHKAMRDCGFQPPGCGDEPFTRLLCQGMVLKDGTKMSKSRGNTVDPQELINTYGADTARMFIIFYAPPEQSLEWSADGVRGCARFLDRLWALARAVRNSIASACGQPDPGSRRELHQILAKADFDMRRLQLNNIVSAGMKMANLLADHKDDHALQKEGWSIMLRVLAPIVPHISEQLWTELGYHGLIANALWPVVDQAALVAAQLSYVVQVDGKRRGAIEVPADATENDLRGTALELASVTRHLNGAAPRKVIIVPGRLINLVT